MSGSPRHRRTRALARFLVRWAVLASAVILALPLLPWDWTPLVLPSLSPYVLAASVLAARAVSVATWIGLPVLAVVLFRRRWFCRYGCPVGCLAEYTTRLRPRRQGATGWAARLPPIGRWAALVTLGGAALGYPFFLWLDPLAIFQGTFTWWLDPANRAGQAAAAALGGILALSFLVPGAWCLRLCPLGATQELLSLPWRLARRRRPAAVLARQAADPGPARLSRRSVLATAFGAFCAAAGATWAAASQTTRGRVRPLRPPGAIDESRFAGQCIRCGNCVRACPVQIVQPDVSGQNLAGLLAPRLSFDADYCREDCSRCGRVCPSGAIVPWSQDAKTELPIGLAQLDPSLCLLYEDRECDICARACPYGAIRIVWNDEAYVPLPEIDAAKCPGCGACQLICPGTNQWEREHTEGPVPRRKAIEVHPVLKTPADRPPRSPQGLP